MICVKMILRKKEEIYKIIIVNEANDCLIFIILLKHYKRYIIGIRHTLYV